MDPNEFLSHERRRGDCYRLLSACYYLPKKELYLGENLFENLSTLLKAVSPDAFPFSAKMGEAILRYSDEELAVDYSRLFVGPYELKAPPYGSVYLEGQRKVMGDSTLEVIRMYQEEGLSMDKDFKELPDHIAVELEFMSFLGQEEIKAYGQGDTEKALNIFKKQEMFLRDHLGAWVFAFTERVQQGCETSFYRNLARCTSLFVKGDMQYFASQPLAFWLPSGDEPSSHHTLE